MSSTSTTTTTTARGASSSRLWLWLVKALKKKCTNRALLSSYSTRHEAATSHPWTLIQCYNCRNPPQTDSFRIINDRAYTKQLGPIPSSFSSSSSLSSSLLSSSLSSISSLDCEAGSLRSNWTIASSLSASASCSLSSSSSCCCSGEAEDLSALLVKPLDALILSHLIAGAAVSTSTAGATVLPTAASKEKAGLYAAVVKYSESPYAEFAKSIAEIIASDVSFIWEEEELHGLLLSYLSLNHPSHHALIKQAYADVLHSITHILDTLH